MQSPSAPASVQILSGISYLIQIGGALGRLGGATKELPANLDIQKDTPKSNIPFEILVFWKVFLGCKCPRSCASVRPCVRPSVRAAVRPDTIR